MATKKQESINLIDNFSEFKELKNIDRQTFINVVEDSFRNVITKMYGTAANYDVIINPDKGDLEIYRNRLVMEDDDVANENTQIGITEALALDDEAEIGEEVTDKVDLSTFGRRMILNLRQTLASRILDLQKESLYLRYSEMLGQVVSGELYQVWKREMLLLDEDGNELYLPKHLALAQVETLLLEVENTASQGLTKVKDHTTTESRKIHFIGYLLANLCLIIQSQCFCDTNLCILISYIIILHYKAVTIDLQVTFIWVDNHIVVRCCTIHFGNHITK